MEYRNANPHTSADIAAQEAAIDAIRDEMAANAKDGAIGVVGQFLTVLLRMQPEHSPLITAEGKSIKGAMEAMKSTAAKHKSGSWAALDFQTGIQIVLEYYGFPELNAGTINSIMLSAAGLAPDPAPAAKPADEFDIDALLAGLEG